jgi:hypothetical protein
MSFPPLGFRPRFLVDAGSVSGSGSGSDTETKDTTASAQISVGNTGAGRFRTRGGFAAGEGGASDSVFWSIAAATFFVMRKRGGVDFTDALF